MPDKPAAPPRAEPPPESGSPEPVSEEARYHLARYLALYRMDVVKAALQAGVGEAQARALLDDPSLMKVVAYNRWVLDQPHEVRQRWLHELALRKLGRTAEADALPGPRSPLCPPTDSIH